MAAPSTNHDVLVVGAGLAGLAAAEALVRRGLDVVVLERGPRAGGVVGSRGVELGGEHGKDHGGGRWLLESGPHSVPATARAFRGAVERLGLESRLVTSLPAARERRLLWRGRLVALPRSPLGLLTTRLVSWRTKLHFLRERSLPFTPPATGEPTLHELVAQRFGDDAAERIAGAFVRGVYAGDARALGAQSAFPRLWRGLVEHGSLLGFLAATRASSSAKSGGATRDTLLSFADGMGELPAAFARFLGTRLALGADVKALTHDGTTFTARLASGETRRARALVLATPVHTTAELLAPLVAHDSAASHAVAALRDVHTNGVTIVHLLFARRPARWLPGFGFLVPPEEERERGTRLLGVLAPSNVFAGRAPVDGALASCFVPSSGESRTAVTARTVRELAGALGLAPDALVPQHVEWNDWPSAAGGIPAYTPGYAERSAALTGALARAVPKAVVVGSYTRGVSVDDVLEHAGAAAQSLADHLALGTALGTELGTAEPS
jgi:oxygen-dependent protoporphyrinogen oxidase